MRILLAGMLAAVVLCGCNRAEKSEDENQPAGRRGGNLIAPGDINDLARVGGGRKQPGNGAAPAPNGQDPPQGQGNPPPVGNGQADAEFGVPGVRPAGTPPSPAQPKNGGPRFGGARAGNSQIVDMKRAMAANPRLQKISLRATGGDPLTFSLNAYVTQRARVQLLNFKHQLRIAAAIEGLRRPSYEQFVRIQKQLRIELLPLPVHRVYAYDATKGEVVILEDPSKRPE